LVKYFVSFKNLIESRTQISFNSCLINLYHDGDEGMGWHSDDEKSLGLNTVIASVSLGAERKFSFRHKDTKETITLLLERGSLLLMKGETQTHWQHSVPKMRKVIHPRINLTFRRFIA
jgi:alkylated DNA repair dioxygenase AlkB